MHQCEAALSASVGQQVTSQPLSVPLKNYWSRAMKDDPIVEEVRQYREQHVAHFNYDLQAIYQDLKEQKHGSERAFASYSPKRLEAVKNSDIIHYNAKFFHCSPFDL
jgi:hypothetical protein